jgi:hypothetical protein
MTYPFFQGVVPSVETCSRQSPIIQGVPVWGLTHAYGNVGAGTNIDFTFGHYQTLSLSQNATLTISAPPGNIDMLLRVTQTGAGNWKITWPLNCLYAGGTPNTLLTPGTVNIAAIDMIRMFYNGTNWILSNFGRDINNAPVSIAVTTVDGTVDPAQTSQCTATATYADLSTQNITGSCAWASSDATKVKMNAAPIGQMEGVAVGPANITATLGTIVGLLAVSCN